MTPWPDLSSFNAAIFKTISSLQSIDGLAVIIAIGDTRTYGMNLMKSGFSKGQSNASQSVYYRTGKASFGLPELKLWFPNFDPKTMLVEIESSPTVHGRGGSLLDENQYSQPAGYQPLLEPEVDDDGYEQAPYARRKMPVAEVSDSVKKDRKPYGVGLDGSVWVNKAMCKGMSEEDIQAGITLTLKEWREHRYGLPENKMLTKAGAEFIAKQLIKSEGNLLDMCVWVKHRFGIFGVKSVDLLIISMKKQKDGKGLPFIKKHEAAIVAMLETKPKTKDQNIPSPS